MEGEREDVKWGEDRTEAAARIVKCFEEGMSYQTEMGFVTNFPKFVDFFEGRQWPKATKNTMNLPRPVFNVTKMIGRNKKSAILSVPGKIVYHAENDSPRVKAFNAFAAYILKEMKQEALDKDAIEDAVRKGSYHYHYYWDRTARGLNATEDGALRCEIVDPLKIFFADPTCRDEQKQKWILIATREEAETVRSYADGDVSEDEILPDENSENYYGEKEQGKGLVTVLTRYFRVGGKVYWEKATKSVLICAARPLKPDVEGALREMDGENGDPQERTVREAAPYKSDDADGFELYPIVSGSYERREGSIYGIGEVEGILPVQKGVNLLFALLLLNNQQVAWGKYVVHPQALHGQRLTNEPGQMVIDYSPGFNGIKKLSEQVMQSQPIELVGTMINMLRSVSGATEVMTGETVGSNMSGAAIAALQAQAQQPVEELRESFWQVKVRQGLVLAEFFKHYYAGKHFTYSVKAEDGTKQIADGVFDGAAFADLTFDVVVEATRGSKSSTAGDINMLDAALASKAIDFETYVSIYPEDAISHKQDLLDALQTLKQSENARLKAQIEQMQAVIEQMQQQAAEDQKAVDAAHRIVQENAKLKQDYAVLYDVAAKRINQGNEIIKSLTAAGIEMATDAAEFAQHIARAEGLSAPQGDGAGAE